MTNFSFPIPFLLYLLYFSFPQYGLSQPYGPITISSSMNCGQIEISDDGEVFLCGASFGLNILSNNMSNFEITQTLSFAQSSYEFEIAGNGRIFIVGRSQIVETYVKDGSGTYILAETINCGFTVTAVQISDDENIIAVGSISGTLKIYRKNTTTYSYYLAEQINDSTNRITQIEGTSDFSVLVTSGDDTIIEIYTNDGTNFNLNQTISKPYGINQMKISETQFVFAGSSSKFSFYKNSGSGYIFEQYLQTLEFQIGRFGISEDFSTIAFGGFSGIMYIYTSTSGSYTLDSSQNTGDMMSFVISDAGGLYFIYLTLFGEIKIRYICPNQCLSCSFPNNCLGCTSGYILEAGSCTIENVNPNTSHTNATNEYTYCVNNIQIADGICEEYCDEKCKTCTNSKYNCSECAKLYIKNEDGECIIEDKSLEAFTVVRPFLNIVRKKGMKTIFMIVDDLWLYQYHKIQYDGLIKSVFKMISFIEEKQWEIIGLNTVVKNVEDNITSIKKYNKFSNKIYLYESRNNNVLIDSTMDFLMFYIPFTLVTVFIWNRVFYLLINYRISLYLRPYSFWFIIADLLIQNNIEFFTFLSFRSVNTMFSYDISSKLMNIVPVIFLFIVFSYVVYSYLFYYYKYGIMARYFLVNMYRFQSSYVLMIVTFGVRPFLKGVVHAMLYENWQLQIWLLIVIQLIIIFAIIMFQMLYDNYKERFILFFQLSNSLSLIALNLMILFKYKYMAGHEEIEAKIQELITILIYFMICSLIARYLIELKNVISYLIQAIKKSREEVNIESKKQIEDNENIQFKKIQKKKKVDQIMAEQIEVVQITDNIFEDHLDEKKQQRKPKTQKQKKKGEDMKKQKQRKQRKQKEQKKQRKKQKQSERAREKERQREKGRRERKNKRAITKLKKIEEVEQFSRMNEEDCKNERDNEVLAYYRKRMQEIEKKSPEESININSRKVEENKSRFRKQKS